MNYKLIKLNRLENGYEINGKPVFNKTFLKAMSFHKEGLAAVQDHEGAYHIDENGNPIYDARYPESFGFYESIATVRDEKGYFHIDTKGNPIHDNRFLWSGNFQEKKCVVQDQSGFCHIDPEGAELYPNRYEYAGDFRHEIAVVKGPKGFQHIDGDGKALNTSSYRFADVYHKGFAVVRDQTGYFHVDLNGNPVYSRRFKYLEPFYNNWALAKDENDRWGRISEKNRFRFLISNIGVITCTEIKKLCENNYKVSLVFRHAERHHIHPDDPEWGDSVELTDNGLRQAKTFGSLINNNIHFKLFSSPILRCKQTISSVARGAGVINPDITESKSLGDPGAYCDGTSDWEAPMKENYSMFCENYMESGEAPGMLPFEETSLAFINWIIKSSTHPLNLYCTHDLFVAMLIEYLGLRTINRHNWVKYIEGFAIIFSPAGSINYKLLKGIGESLC